MKIALRIEGDYARKVIEVERVNTGWDMLTLMVDEYLAVLVEVEHLSWQHDKWDMFRDELAARALKPWADYDVIEAPSGHLWGVERKHD